MSGSYVDVELREPITEDDMIAAFLAAEIDSRRFAAKVRAAADAIGLSEAEIRGADTQSPETNSMRRRALVEYRGWGTQHSVFGGLPTDTITWWSADLAWSALDRVEVINYQIELSHAPTRSLFGLRQLDADAADPEDRIATLARLRRGERLVTPILISMPSLDRFVILEGHTRLAAYASLGKDMPAGISVTLGLTPDAAAWSEW